MSDNRSEAFESHVRDRQARATALTRIVAQAGVDAFKDDREAIPIDLMVAYVYALAAVIVAYENVRPNAGDLTSILAESLAHATAELRAADANDALAAVLVELQSRTVH